MSRPRIAVCGAGLIGRRHLAEVARAAALCAIVDPAPDAAQLARAQDAPCFDDLPTCLDETHPDAVIIATPNHLHADQAILCLERGIPVLIEKPIADTVPNADRITQAQARTGVPVLVGHHRRHNPIIKTAKAIIDQGQLGTLVTVHGQFWLYKPDDYFEADWRTKPGAGPLLINCIHDIDLLRHLCGDISNVQAMRSNAQRGHAVEDTLALLLRFENGALGTFSVSDTVVAPWSWEMTSGENSIYPHLATACYQFGGTEASLSLPDLRIWSHQGPKSWWSDMVSTHNPVPREDAFSRQMDHFLAVIKGASPLVSAREGRDSLKIVLRALSRS